MAALYSSSGRSAALSEADPAGEIPDFDGNDWEFVEYLSEVPAERHDYALPDR